MVGSDERPVAPETVNRIAVGPAAPHDGMVSMSPGLRDKAYQRLNVLTRLLEPI